MLRVVHLVSEPSIQSYSYDGLKAHFCHDTSGVRFCTTKEINALCAVAPAQSALLDDAWVPVEYGNPGKKDWVQFGGKSSHALGTSHTAKFGYVEKIEASEGGREVGSSS